MTTQNLFLTTQNRFLTTQNRKPPFTAGVKPSKSTKPLQSTGYRGFQPSLMSASRARKMFPQTQRRNHLACMYSTCWIMSTYTCVHQNVFCFLLFQYGRTLRCDWWWKSEMKITGALRSLFFFPLSISSLVKII